MMTHRLVNILKIKGYYIWINEITPEDLNIPRMMTQRPVNILYNIKEYIGVMKSLKYHEFPVLNWNLVQINVLFSLWSNYQHEFHIITDCQFCVCLTPSNGNAVRACPIMAMGYKTLNVDLRSLILNIINIGGC